MRTATAAGALLEHPRNSAVGTGCAAGFVGVSVGGQRMMTVDFYTLEGGTTPAYSAAIALHPPATKG